MIPNTQNPFFPFALVLFIIIRQQAYTIVYIRNTVLSLGLAAAFFKLGNFLLFCRRRAPSAASPPRRLSVLRLLLVNHTLKIGGEIMADAPTNLMAKYYVQESSGDYSSQSVSIFMMETSGTLER